MANIEIRALIARNRLRYYEVAAALGVTPFTFSRWMSMELTPERREQVLDAISKIRLEGVGN